ncbi:MAG: tetratricopeptide repeat protein [Armatimonadetes bacterium]|nr:tetratricopeptide repeat protein [Armatimonadota bacterium]
MLTKSHSKALFTRAASACAILVALTLLVFAQSVHFEFVGYDDPDYVYQNRHVQEGLSLRSVAWSFRATEKGTWQPLTWLSLIADYQIYGLKAGGFHATNVALHLFSVLLLFWFLRRETGAIWRSFFVAALFAIHPLRVESVAWVTERKDVLCGVFWMLALLSYGSFVRRRGVWRYGCVLFWFACALMSKPMALTLPLALLLLDYWPLQRLTNRKGFSALVREKIPLLALAVLSAAVTFYVQNKAGAVRSVEEIPVAARLLNVPVAYSVYILKTLWPSNLAVLYPHPRMHIPLWQVIASVGVLAGVSWGVARPGGRQRYLSAGWWWYLLTLLPVIGIVQIGEHQYADRFTYLPCIGLYIMAVWGVGDWAKRFQINRAALALGGATVVTVLTVVAWHQTAYWKNSLTLFQHTVAVTRNNKIAENNYGGFLSQAGRRREAIEHYSRALKIDPEYPMAWVNLGVEYLHTGDISKALDAFQKALKKTPHSSLFQANYALALQRAGRSKEAEEAYLGALRSNPSSQLALQNYGYFLLQQGRAKEALDQFRSYVVYWPNSSHGHVLLAFGLRANGRAGVRAELETALRLDPHGAEARLRLGDTLKAEGDVSAAIRQYRAGLKHHPQHSELLNNLAWTLATASQSNLRRPSEALKLAESAAALKPDDPGVLDTLAAAQAANKDYAQAVRTQERVVALLQGAGAPASQERLRLALYRQRHPYYR